MWPAVSFADAVTKYFDTNTDPVDCLRRTASIPPLYGSDNANTNVVITSIVIECVIASKRPSETNTSSLHRSTLDGKHPKALWITHRTARSRSDSRGIRPVGEANIKAIADTKARADRIRVVIRWMLSNRSCDTDSEKSAQLSSTVMSTEQSRKASDLAGHFWVRIWEWKSVLTCFKFVTAKG